MNPLLPLVVTAILRDGKMSKAVVVIRIFNAEWHLLLQPKLVAQAILNFRLSFKIGRGAAS